VKTLLPALALLLFSGFGFWFTQANSPPPAPTIATTMSLDSQTPITLKMQTGQKGLALFFFSFNCPCARGCVEIVREQAAELRGLGYATYAVSTDRKTPKDRLKRIFERAALGMPTLDDTDWKLVKKFGIQTSAEMVLLAEADRSLYQGAIVSEKEDFLREIVEDLKSGRAPRLAKGSGLGCALENPDEDFVW
jgi:peroxiredoxin